MRIHAGEVRVSDSVAIMDLLRARTHSLTILPNQLINFFKVKLESTSLELIRGISKPCHSFRSPCLN